MTRFIVHRMGQGLVTLVLISITVFGLVRLTGNPANAMLPIGAGPEAYERIAAHWGLNEPLPVQYGRFLSNALRGDLGESISRPGRAALEVVLERVPATLLLGGASLLLATLTAVVVGVMSAAFRGSIMDKFGKLVALVGQSIPAFFLALLLMWFFALRTGLFPVAGYGTWRHLVLPTTALGWYYVAAIMRLTRSAMLDALDQDYILHARAKGLPGWQVIWKHAFRNALLTPLTYVGIVLGFLMAGSVAVEAVFSWPGIGLLVVDAVKARDFPLVQCVVLLFGALFVAINVAVDIVYAYLDPRIRIATE